MAINYPANCRNITAGAMRQLKQRGYTTASGGLTQTEAVKNMAQHTRPAEYFSNREPAGIFMSNLESQKQAIEETTEAILAATRRMVDVAKESNKEMAGISGKMRASTESLGAAIDKLTKIASRGDFEKTVALTSTLVDALERLAVLEEKGMLDKVIKAMRP